MCDDCGKHTSVAICCCCCCCLGILFCFRLFCCLFRRDRAHRLFGIGHGGINLGFALLEKVFQKGIVQEFGTLCLRKHGPQQKCQFERVVERDPIQKEINEHFDDREKGKDDPVHQPLRVLSLVLRFNGLERFEGGVNETNDAAERASAYTKEDQKDKDNPTPDHEVFLWDFDRFLQGKKRETGRQKHVRFPMGCSDTSCIRATLSTIKIARKTCSSHAVLCPQYDSQTSTILFDVASVRPLRAARNEPSAENPSHSLLKLTSA